MVSLSTAESEIMSYTKVSQAANLPEGTVWHSDCRLFGIQIAAAVFGDDVVCIFLIKNQKAG